MRGQRLATSAGARCLCPVVSLTLRMFSGAVARRLVVPQLARLASLGDLKLLATEGNPIALLPK